MNHEAINIRQKLGLLKEQWSPRGVQSSEHPGCYTRPALGIRGHQRLGSLSHMQHDARRP